MISLGIDTSCYTTSMVVMSDEKILYKNRKMLHVKKGTAGLRQADAFFQHVQNLPELYKELVEKVDVKTINKVVVSNQPRPIEGSYMPVFTAGMRFAETIAYTLNVPLVHLSHQENHIYACLLEHPLSEPFIGVHLSGGTSEILDVSDEIQVIGETLDLSFGKLIDRLGVYMGLDFPCGQSMDQYQSAKLYPLKLSVKDMSFNISGVENQLKQYFDQDHDIERISVTLFEYLSKLIINILEKALQHTGYHNIIMSGGVTANRIMRQRLMAYFGERIKFTSIEFATDHAIGNAYYGNMER